MQSLESYHGNNRSYQAVCGDGSGPQSKWISVICMDLTKLNENECRERHMLLSVEQVQAMIGDTKHSSKLDANSGFWQIELDEQSSKLTTFIT